MRNKPDFTPESGKTIQKIGIPLAAVQVRPAAELMARAFHEDPFFRFVLPDESRRRRILPWLFERTIVYGLRYGRVLTTPSLEGVALWLGPEKPTLTWIGTLLTGLFLLPLKLTSPELGRSLRLAGIAERLHKQSASGRHWYLLELGVDPSWQGHGLGGALLQPVLASADREKLVCYLDTNNEQNIPFYERYGFALASQGGQASPLVPPTWALRREPR
jgi:ribosomal protein S18 acetylase RimI-like enzyme